MTDLEFYNRRRNRDKWTLRVAVLGICITLLSLCFVPFLPFISMLGLFSGIIILFIGCTTYV